MNDAFSPDPDTLPPSKTSKSMQRRALIEPIILLSVLGAIIGYLSFTMGVTQFFNTVFNTAHQLMLNTVLYLMGITVLAGAIGRLLTEFHVVSALERLLRPLMRPIFNLPGQAAMAAVMTFFSDNPAVIGLAKDRRFKHLFKTTEFISLTNFATAFGLGLIVVTFMATVGDPDNPLVYAQAALIGLIGALVGAVVSTRLMQRLIRKEVQGKSIPSQDNPPLNTVEENPQSLPSPSWLRFLNALLDGGKYGVETIMTAIPGILIVNDFDLWAIQ